ncbi:DMT family transporter [Billgrantia gudaonensis]|uniref:Permease of the drug/metabolite transporter (DMT) superfamily n=1 Tax=Billgrantia gudaonensis TaxID=376427 RepID=A0A1G8R5L9_9GAMM|nr:DMT family transporter [Halomonas gudaonensis]SDJ12266.1 Permease of the drug/metabolite transporter (DMT) superfamily [Halomonas gudaonensis]
MKTIDRTMGPMEWALLLTLSMLWGGSFFFVGVAVEELGPLTIVALRVGLAALALNALILLLGQRMPRDRGLWAAFFGMGLLNNMIPFSLIAWGQGHIASGLASILNATTPFFTIVVAHFLTRDEPFTPGRLAGVAIGFIGVAYMLGTEVHEGAPSHSWAQLAVLAGALSYAFAGVFGRRFRALGCSPLIAACGQVTASALVLMPLALAVERFWQQPWPGLETWSAVFGLALFSTALAYLLYFRLLATAGATNLLLVTFLIPASAILLGTFVLGERLEWRHLTGMGLIGIGLAAIDGRPSMRLRKMAFACWKARRNRVSH